MRLRFLRGLVACLSIGALAPAPVLGKDLATRKWIEVSTPHFRVQSRLNEKRTVEPVRYLDLMRRTVPLITNLEIQADPIPTHVVTLSTRGELGAFGMGQTVAGVFASGLRNNTILLRNVIGMDETHVMLHEYVHYLTATDAGFDYPLWFREGIAEYLAGSRIEDGYFYVGVPRRESGDLRSRKWLSAEKLLDSRGYRKLRGPEVLQFYEQSWLLVQFLLSSIDDFPGAMQHYLEQRSAGVAETEAFEDAFGVAAPDLNQAMRTYLFNGCCKVFRLSIEALQPDFQANVTVPDEHAVALRLGQIALRFGEEKMARRWFEYALDSTTTRARAEAGLGDLLKFAGEYEAAEAYFDRALEAGPDDPYVQLDTAEFWLNRYLSDEAAPERDGYLSLAKKHFVASWKLDDTIPETYVFYGRSLMVSGDDYAQAVLMLEEGLRRLPTHARTRAWLAEAYARAGRVDDAVRTANSIIHLGHGNAEFAKEALALVEDIAGADATQVAGGSP